VFRANALFVHDLFDGLYIPQQKFAHDLAELSFYDRLRFSVNDIGFEVNVVLALVISEYPVLEICYVALGIGRGQSAMEAD
jgi:hypothetical protein